MDNKNKSGRTRAFSLKTSTAALPTEMKSKRILADEPRQFSQRTFGELQPCRGTIRNERDKLGRNRVLRINNSAPDKFKRSPVNRLPIPHRID